MDANSPSLNRALSISPIQTWLKVLLFVIPATFISIFFILPVTALILKAIDASELLDAFAKPGTWSVIRFTFVQAALSTFATLVIGIWPTYLLARYQFRGRKFLNTLIVVPFMLPTVVVASSFLILLPRSLHYSIWAVIIVHIYFNVTVIAKIVGSSLEQVPIDLESASATLGISPFRTFFKVTLPLTVPALISACCVVFLFCFTSFGVISVIGGPANSTIETEIARRALNLGDLTSATMLSLSQLVFLGLTLVIAHLLSNRFSLRFSSTGVARRVATTIHQKIGIGLGTTCLYTAILLPIAALLWSSVHIGDKFSFYAWTHLGAHQIRSGISIDIDPRDAILTSLGYLFWAVLFTLIVGLTAALFIYKSKRFGPMLDAIAMAPMATSAVTIGLGILITFNTEPFNWRASTLMIPIGHCLIAIPFTIRTLLPVLRSIPNELRQAAHCLGASPQRVLFDIDLAQCKRAIISSIGITAAISLGEFGATTLLSRSSHDSMPIAITKLVGMTGDIPRAQAFVLSSLLAICTLVLVFMIEAKNA